MNLAGGQTFPKGGVLTISTAVAGAAGEPLAGSHTFVISKGGKDIGGYVTDRPSRPFVSPAPDKVSADARGTAPSPDALPRSSRPGERLELRRYRREAELVAEAE